MYSIANQISEKTGSIMNSFIKRRVSERERVRERKQERGILEGEESRVAN